MPNERENKPFQFEPFAISTLVRDKWDKPSRIYRSSVDSGFSATRGYLDFMSCSQRVPASNSPPLSLGAEHR